MGLQRTARLPIFGLGCAGDVLGLARAAHYAAIAPRKLVLLLVVELCALSFRRDDWSKSNIATEGQGLTITAAREYTWPSSLDVMRRDVADVV